MQLNQSFYFSMESLFKDLTDVPGAVERFKTIYENTKLEGYSYFVIAGLSLLLNLPQVHPDYPALQLFFEVSRFVLETMEALQQYVRTIHYFISNSFISNSSAPGTVAQRILDLTRLDTQVPNIGVITEYLMMVISIPDFRSQTSSEQAHAAITSLRSQGEVLAYLFYVVYCHRDSYSIQCGELLKSYMSRGMQPSPYLNNLLTHAINYYVGPNYQIQQGMAISPAYSQSSPMGMQQRQLQCTPQFSNALYNKDIAIIVLNVGPISINDRHFLQYVLNICQPITTVKLVHLIMALSSVAGDPCKYINQLNMAYFIQTYLSSVKMDQAYKESLLKQQYSQYHINAIFSVLRNGKVDVQWKDILSILEQQVTTIDTYLAQTIITAYIGYYIDSNPNICLCASCASTFGSPSCGNNASNNVYIPPRARQAIDKPSYSPVFGLFDYVFRDTDRGANYLYYFEANFFIGSIIYFNQLVRVFNKMLLTDVIPYLKEGKELPPQFEQQYIPYCKVFFIFSQICSPRVTIEKGNIHLVKGFPILAAMDMLYYAFKPQSNLFHPCLSQKSGGIFTPDLLEYIYDVFNPINLTYPGNPHLTPASSQSYNSRASRPESWIWSSPNLVKSIFRIYPLVAPQVRTVFNDILGLNGNRSQYGPDPISRCPDQLLVTLTFADMDMLPVLQDSDRQQQQVKKPIAPLYLLAKPHELITKAMLRVCTTFLLQKYLFKATKQQTNQGYIDAIVATNPDIVLFACEVFWRRNPNNMGKVIDVIQELRLIEPIVRTWRSFEFVCDAAAFASGREFLNPALFIINAMQTYGRTFAEEFLIFILKKSLRTLRNIDGKTMREMCLLLTEEDVKLCSMVLLPYAGDQSRCRQNITDATISWNGNLLEILDILAKKEYSDQAAKLRLMGLLTEPLVITAQGNSLQTYHDMNFLDIALTAVLPTAYNQYKLRAEQYMLSSSPITESMQLVFFKFSYAYRTYFKLAFPEDTYLESLFRLVEKVIKHCLPEAEIIEKSPMGVFFDVSTTEQNIWNEATTTLQKYLQGRLSSDEMVTMAATRQKNSCSTLAYQMSYCTLMHTIIELLDTPVRCAELLGIGEHDAMLATNASRDELGVMQETPLLRAELSLAALGGLLMGSGVLSDVFVPRLCTLLLKHLNSTVPFFNEVGMELLCCFYKEVDAVEKDSVRSPKRWTATFSHIYNTRYFTELSAKRYVPLSAEKQKYCEKIESERFGIIEETPIDVIIDRLFGDKKAADYDLTKVYQTFMSGTSLNAPTTQGHAPQVLYSSASQNLSIHREQDKSVPHLPAQNCFAGLLSRYRHRISPTLVKAMDDISAMSVVVAKQKYAQFVTSLLGVLSNGSQTSLGELVARLREDVVFQQILSYYLVSTSLSSNDGSAVGVSYRSGSFSAQASLSTVSLITDINLYLRNDALIDNLANVAILSSRLVDLYEASSVKQRVSLKTMLFHYSLVMLWDLVDSILEADESGIHSESLGRNVGTLAPVERQHAHVALLAKRYKRAITLGHWLGFLVFGARYAPLKQDINFLELIDISAHRGTFILLVFFFRSFLRHSLDSPGLPATSGLVIMIISKLYDTLCNINRLTIRYPVYQLEIATALIGDFQEEAYTCLEHTKLYQHNITHNSSLQGLFSSSELICTSHVNGDRTELALKPPPFKYIDPAAKTRQASSINGLNMLRLERSFNPLSDTPCQAYCIPPHIFRSEMRLGVLCEIQRNEDPQQTPFPLILSFLTANPSLYAFFERAVQIICNMPELVEGKRRACFHARNLVYTLLQESSLSICSRGSSTPSMASIKSQTGPSSSSGKSSHLPTVASNISLKNASSDETNPNFAYVATTYIATSLFRASAYTIICSKIRLLLHKSFYWVPTAREEDLRLQRLLEDTIIEGLIRLAAEYALSLLHKQIRDFSEVILTSKKDRQMKFTNACNTSTQNQEDSEYSELSYQQGDTFSLQFLAPRADTAFTTNSTPLCCESTQKFSTTSVVSTVNKPALSSDLLRNLCSMYEQLDSCHRLKGDMTILRDLAPSMGHRVTTLYPYVIKGDSVMFSVPYSYFQLYPVEAPSLMRGVFSHKDIELILSVVFGYKINVLSSKPISLSSPDSAKPDAHQMLHLQVVANSLAAKMSTHFSSLKWTDSRVINGILLSTYSQAASMFTAINDQVPLLPHLEGGSRSTSGFTKTDMQLSMYSSLLVLGQSISQSMENMPLDGLPDIYSLQIDHPVLIPLHSIRAAASLYGRNMSTQTRGAFVSFILSFGEWAISHVSLDTSMGIAEGSGDWKPAFDIANAFQMSTVISSKSDLQSLVFKDISYSEILDPLLSSFAKVATPSLEQVAGKGYRPFFDLRSYYSQVQFIDLICTSTNDAAARLRRHFLDIEKPHSEELLSLNFFKHICTYNLTTDVASYSLNSSLPVGLFKILLTVAFDLDIPELCLKLLTLVKLRLVTTIAHAMLWELFLAGINKGEQCRTVDSTRFWFADVLAIFGLNLVKCRIIPEKILDTTISGAFKYICNYLNRHYEKRLSSSNRAYLAIILTKLTSESGVYLATCCHDLVSAISKIVLGLCFTGSITYLPSCCNASSLPMICHFLAESYINTLETISLLQAQEDQALGVLSCSKLPPALERLMRLFDMVGDCSSEEDDYLNLYRLLISTGYNPFSAHGFSSNQSDFLRVLIKTPSSDGAEKCTIESQVLDQFSHLEHLHNAILEDMDLTQHSAPLSLSVLAYKMLTHLITVVVPQLSDTLSKEDEYSLMSHYIARFNALGYFMGDTISSLLIDAVLHKLLKRSKGNKLCNMANGLGVFICYLIYACPEHNLSCSYNKSAVLAHFLERLLRFTSYLTSFKYKNSYKLQGLMNFRSLDLLPNMTLRTDSGKAESQDVVVDSACITLYRILTVLSANLFSKSSPVFAYRHDFIYVLTHYLLYISPQQSILFNNLFLAIISESSFIDAALSMSDLDALSYCSFSLEYAIHYAASTIPSTLNNVGSPIAASSAAAEVTKELWNICADVGIEYLPGSSTSSGHAELLLSSSAQHHLLQMKSDLSVMSLNAIPLSLNPVYNQFFTVQVGNPSWKHYLRLLCEALEFIQLTPQILRQLNTTDVYNANNCFVKSTLRLLELLRHDFPSFISFYKMHLASRISSNHKALRCFILSVPGSPLTHYQIANSMDLDVVRDVKEICLAPPLAGFHTGLATVRSPSQVIAEFSHSIVPVKYTMQRHAHPAAAAHDSFVIRLRETGALAQINELRKLAAKGTQFLRTGSVSDLQETKNKLNREQASALIEKLCAIFVANAADQSGIRDMVFIYSFVFYACSELLSCILASQRALSAPGEMVVFQLFERLLQHQSVREYHLKHVLHTLLIHLGEPNRISYMFALLLRHLITVDLQLRRTLKECVEEIKPADPPWALRILKQVISEGGS